MRVVNISDIVHRLSPITNTSFFRKANPMKFPRYLTQEEETDPDPAAKTLWVV